MSAGRASDDKRKNGARSQSTDPVAFDYLAHDPLGRNQMWRDPLMRDPLTTNRRVGVSGTRPPARRSRVRRLPRR